MKTETRDLLLKLAHLLWPKFYNRITWMIVAGGLALISTPLWERALDAVLQVTVNVRLFGPFDPVIGLALVALALTYNAFIQWATLTHAREGRAVEAQRRRDHDIARFRHFERVCSERTLSAIINHIGTHHATGTDQLQPLYETLREGALAENAYLDKELADSLGKVMSSLNAMLRTIEREFFRRRNYREEVDEWSFRMRPDWNVDLDGSGEHEEFMNYEKSREKLNESIDAVEDTYKKYRMLVKQRLHI